jgi:hypothetical protein
VAGLIWLPGTLREEANRIIATHNARPGSIRYSDWSHAHAVVYEEEMKRTHSGWGYNAQDAAWGPVGEVGAQRSTGKVGPVLVMRLPGPVSSYFIGPLDDGEGVGLFQHSSSEVPYEAEPGRMSDPDQPETPKEQRMSGRTSSRDVVARLAEEYRSGRADRPLRFRPEALLRMRDNAQKKTLHSINEANRQFWAQPEAQGKW